MRTKKKACLPDCWKRGKLCGTTKKTVSFGCWNPGEALWNYEEDDLLACWKRGKHCGTSKNATLRHVGNEGSFADRSMQPFGMLETREALRYHEEDEPFGRLETREALHVTKDTLPFARDRMVWKLDLTTRVKCKVERGGRNRLFKTNDSLPFMLAGEMCNAQEAQPVVWPVLGCQLRMLPG